MNLSQLSSNNTEKPPQWLDIVLKGKSASVKAKVMEVTTKMGIDPDDEFLVIFVALGQFIALVEKCPSQWDKLFTEFQEDLERWGEDFRQQLTKISVDTKQLTLDVQEKLEELEGEVYEIEEQLEIVKGLINSLERQLQGQNEQLLREIADLKDYHQQLIKSFNQVVRFLSSQQPKSQAKWDFLPPKVLKWLKFFPTNWLTSPQWRFVSYGLVLLLGWGIARAMYLPDKRLTQTMAQQTQWLLDKANRRDCLERIKPPSSPECHKVFEQK